MIARARRVRRSPIAPAAAAVRLATARRLLLDTQVWLWWQGDDPRLGGATRDAIAGASEVRFSAASAWEIEIKVALGKLSMPRGDDIAAEMDADGFEELPVSVAHARAVRELPLLHRDPFDRMLVAQALAEQLVIVTADPGVRQYPVAVLWATD